MFSSFTLSKRASIYNNKTVLNEYIPDNRLNALIQHNISVSFSIDNYQRKTYGFVNEMAYYNTLLSKFNKKENCFKIKLRNSPYGWGRINAVDNSTLSVFHRPTRHSLCNGKYVDIDITACCQSIFYNLVENNGLVHEYPRLKQYIDTRSELFQHYMAKYNVNRDTIKKLFTAIGFGGSATSWFSKSGIEFDNDPFIVDLNNEYYKLADIIYNANPKICQDVEKALPTKFDKYNYDPRVLLSKKKRTTMALVYQTAERYAQESAIGFLCDVKGFNLKDIVPCQDGFMILSELMYPDLCIDCQTIVKRSLNMDLNFVVKEFDERFEIPPYMDPKELEKAQREEQKALEKAQREEEKALEKQRKEQAKIQKKREVEATIQTIENQKEAKKTEEKDAITKREHDMLLEQIEKHIINHQLVLPSKETFDNDLTNPETRWLIRGCMTDKEAAEKLFRLYPFWITCMGELYVFDYTTGMYSCDNVTHHKIITAHSTFLHIMLKDESHDKDWYRSENRSYGNTAMLIDKLILFLKTINVNNDWLKKSQPTSLGKILFENGYYVFNENIFYHEFDPNIVFFGRIHHSYIEDIEDADMDYIETIKQRLFYDTLGQEVGDYFILNLARGLSGECMKRILFAIGDTNCGKGVITTATALSIGDYFGAFNAESLAHRESSQDEAQIMRWVMLLRYKRVIISNEMKSGMTLNGNFIKKICSGGDTLIGRTHCKEETEFNTHFLPIILDNDMNQITPYDTAVDNRVRCLSFPKSFVDRPPENEFEMPMDINIKEELKTLRFQRCFVIMLLQAHCKYLRIDNKIENEPADVRNSKKEMVETTANINWITAFLKDYEITNDITDYVSSSSIEDWIKSKKLNISMLKFSKDMKKYTTLHKIENVTSKDKKVNKRNIKCWFGIKAIDEVEEEDM